MRRPWIHSKPPASRIPVIAAATRLQAVGAPHAGEHTVYDGHCYGLSEAQRKQMTKKPSWRVHVPERTISFTDGVYGPFHEDLTRCCGDFVVRRADDMYAYQLAVSVDGRGHGHHPRPAR